MNYAEKLSKELSIPEHPSYTPVVTIVPVVFRKDRVFLQLVAGKWQFPKDALQPFEQIEYAAIRITKKNGKLLAKFSHVAFVQEHIDEPTKAHFVYQYVVGEWRGGLIQEPTKYKFFTKEELLTGTVLEPMTAHAIEQLRKRP